VRIAYVLYGEATSPVVRAQTLPLLAGLAARGHEPRLIAITSPRRRLDPAPWRESLDTARAGLGDAGVEVFSHLPKHAGMRITARRLAKRLRRFRPDVVHARQSRAGLLAARAGVAPVLLDARGVRPEEYLMGLGKEEADLDESERRELARLREWDREAMDGAAVVVCVSEPYRRHLGGGDRIRVIPNAAAPAPAVAAATPKEGFAFVYSGSLAAWQCAREALALVAAVRNSRPDARLSLLVHDRAAGERLAHGVSGVDVESLPPARLRGALPAFDAALLLRRRSLVNEVACPVKFAEYLHAGLPVILTEGIGDASGWVRDHGLGVVLPDPTDPGNADRVLGAMPSFDPDRCRRFAAERLSFDVTIPLYEEAYAAAVRA
jgi:glycosyltransferase involved in cell wall biosynthesis